MRARLTPESVPGADRRHHVVEADPVDDRPAAAHPDQAAAAVVDGQLGGVDADRGHAHAGSHHRDGPPPVGAGVAQHVADRGHLAGVLEMVFGDPAGPEGVAGQQDQLGEVAGLGGDVSGGHGGAACHGWSGPG